MRIEKVIWTDWKKSFVHSILSFKRLLKESDQIKDENQTKTMLELLLKEVIRKGSTNFKASSNRSNLAYENLPGQKVEIRVKNSNHKPYQGTVERWTNIERYQFEKILLAWSKNVLQW